MAQAVKALPPHIAESTDIRVWDLRQSQARERARVLGVKSLPALYLEGRPIFRYQIPGPDDIAELIEDWTGG